MTYELLGERFIPRTAIWGDVRVLSSNGVPRPALARPLQWITVHYTGNDIRYADRDPIAELKNLQVVMAATKPWEYNFVFFQDGRVAEYAGFFQAAHSLGENEDALGCLFLNGIDEPLTEAQVNTFRTFREDLRLDGDLSRFPDITPHKDMPEASTPCPGIHILARWNDLTAQVVVPMPRSGGVPVPTLREGSVGAEAHRLINVLKFWRWYPAEHLQDFNDSRIGSRAAAGIRIMQSALDDPVTGVYSMRTAATYKAFADVMTALAA